MEGTWEAVVDVGLGVGGEVVDVLVQNRQGLTGETGRQTDSQQEEVVGCEGRGFWVEAEDSRGNVGNDRGLPGWLVGWACCRGS